VEKGNEIKVKLFERTVTKRQKVREYHLQKDSGRQLIIPRKKEKKNIIHVYPMRYSEMPER